MNQRGVDFVKRYGGKATLKRAAFEINSHHSWMLRSQIQESMMRCRLEALAFGVSVCGQDERHSFGDLELIAAACINRDRATKKIESFDFEKMLESNPVKCGEPFDFEKMLAENPVKCEKPDEEKITIWSKLISIFR